MTTNRAGWWRGAAFVMQMLTGLLLLVLPGSTGAQAQSTPTTGPYSYHEMQTLSGLSGGSLGVDAQGYVSLSGPIAFSTPVANTLGHNHFWVGYGQYSYKSYPVLSDRNSNSSLVAMYGTTLGRRVNMSVAANIVDTRGNTAADLQFQYIPTANEHIAYAVGIADLFDTLKSYDNAGRRVSSFSPFGVATYGTSLGRYAVNLSAGTGMRRFAPLFGSATLQIAHPLRLWSEQDRYGNVTGLTFGSKLGNGSHSAPFTLSLGLAHGRYAISQLGIGF